MNQCSLMWLMQKNAARIQFLNYLLMLADQSSRPGTMIELNYSLLIKQLKCSQLAY